MGNPVPDSLWERAEPLLPACPPRRYRHPGRRRADDPAVLTGVVFVLKTGICWNQLPRESLGVPGVGCALVLSTTAALSGHGRTPGSGSLLGVVPGLLQWFH
ncbi:transposase [Kocuria oceani]